jgi:hypothetical protein
MDVQLATVRDRLRAMRVDERAIRTMLVLTYEVLRQRQLLADLDRWRGREAATIAASAEPCTDYPQLVESIHRLVARVVPQGARILLISRGDDELLVPGYAASHFPSAHDGLYAGHYPADGPAACAHLEDRCATGAEYLIVPSTAFWWLDYYAGLAQYLLAQGRVVHHDGECLIVRLNPLDEGEAG